MPRSSPTGLPSIVPRLVAEDSTELAEFVVGVFGAEGEVRNDRPTELTLGDSVLMISDGGGVRAETSSFLYVNVDNVDDVFDRAKDHGVTVLEPPTDQSYGDRRAMFQDRWGNLWQVATPAA